MSRSITFLCIGLVASSIASARTPVEAPIAESAPISPLEPMDWTVTRQKTLAWAGERTTEQISPETIQARLDESPSPATPHARHVRVIQIFAELDPPTAELLVSLDPRQISFVPPDPLPLLEASSDPFYRTNMAIETGQMLVDRRLFDEALLVFEHVDPRQAIDPATALFYQAVCQHQLMMREQGLQTIEQLLAAEWPAPESYRSVARLMKAELEALKPDTLGEIAGLMDDVERRLELARGGKRVQSQEEQIAKKLEEMIKKLEEQQQQQQQASAGGSSGNRNQSSNPLDDSIVKGQTAPGEVDPKDVRDGGNWGDLPPREREAAKNEIEKAFPSNYSRLINEYFLKRTREE